MLDKLFIFVVHGFSFYHRLQQLGRRAVHFIYFIEYRLLVF